MARFKILFILIHIVLGFVLYQYQFLSTIYGLFIILLGTYYILSKPDIVGKYPFIFSAYIVGAEVLLRMTGAKLFWEFGKYSVIYFFLLGMLRKETKTPIYLPVIYYFLLLLPALIVMPFESFNFWRQDVAFNLSGPAVLVVCSIYFYNYVFDLKILKSILFFMILPIISMSIYNILTMPDLFSYEFMPYSNFYTSGNYGPNQVSTIFGLGIASLLVSIVLKINVTGSKSRDIVIIILFFILGLITFSRGGMFGAILSFSIAISFYFFHNEKKMQMVLKSFSLILILIASWFFVASATDGVIIERYGLGRAEHGQKFFLDLTGRAELYAIDLEIFFDNIFTGVGPGQSAQLRKLYGYTKKVAAHTEYSRMLAEHGILGLFSLIILLFVTFHHLFSYSSLNSKFIKIIFGCLALLTMTHSAMRLAMPPYIFSFIFLNIKD